MKRWICWLLVLILALAAAPPAAAQTGSPLGDVNADGRTDARDALLILQAAVGKAELTNEQFNTANVSAVLAAITGEAAYGDHTIDAQDAFLVLAFAVGTGPFRRQQSDRDPYYAKLSGFSARLYEMSRAQAKGSNYVMSPVSLYMAMAMLHAVGDATVKNEVETLLAMSADDVARAGALYQALNQSDADGTPVILSNSIWLDARLQTRQNALDDLANNLHCGAFRVPFADDNSAANQQVRDYVKEKTNGLIDRDFQMDRDTLVSLINTVCFADVWDMKGVDLPVRPMPFNRADGKVTMDFLLGKHMRGEVAETEKARYFPAVTAHGYRLVLVLPKQGCSLAEATAADSLQRINMTDQYERMYADGARHYTRCVFPRFSIESTTAMKDVLENNGYLEHTFDAYDSTLTDQPLRVSRILHQATVEVNEHGAKGAAATIVDNEPGAAAYAPPVYFHDFVVDGPFGFLITDANGVVLFAGQVVDPQPNAMPAAANE